MTRRTPLVNEDPNSDSASTAGETGREATPRSEETPPLGSVEEGGPASSEAPGADEPASDQGTKARRPDSGLLDSPIGSALNADEPGDNEDLPLLHAPRLEEDRSLAERRRRRAALLAEPEEATGTGERPLWQKIALICLLILGIGAVGSIATILGVVQHFSSDLPDVHELEKGYAPPQVTRVLARDGTLLANVFSERRTVVPIEKVPDHVKSAFLAAEDARFFEHEGLNYLGMLRAMAVNLRSGSVRQGGSTITQQVVKNVLLDHERSYKRKIRETILAYRLEKTLSKEQILGMYMNHIYLGHGRYGVEEAGRYYFGKHVEHLTVAEAALLAGIVAAPERYSPRKDEEKALARRSYVLGQMLEKGFMTRAVYDATMDVPIRLAPTAETESDIAPEMVALAQRNLRTLVGERAKKGGFTITSTIDPALQVAARKAVREGLDDYMKRQKLAAPYTLEQRRLWGKVFTGMPRRYGIYVGKVLERNDELGEIRLQVGDVVGVVDLKREERFNPTHASPSDFVGPGAALRVQVIDDPTKATPEEPVRLRLELGPQAALVALDPKTREVLAAVGSYEALVGGLDRATQTKRQPGSTFKPIVYSYALNTHQVTPATQFEVERTKAERDQALKEAREAAGEEALLSENEDVPDTVTMSLRQGIAKSDNRVARQVFREVGGQQAVQWAQAMGITSHLGPDESLMLGSYEVTVAEMAGAFSVFASGGTAYEPLFVRSIASGSGSVELPERAPERRVMDPAVAYVTTDLLRSVVEEGTGRRAASLKRPLAGKTGTTNQAKDAWFIGYSTDLVVAVWVGYDDALPLGWGEAGATSALPIWMAFMKEAHEGKPATEFPRPTSVQEALIDPATGLLARFGQEDAETEIFLAGTVPTESAPDPSDVAEEEQQRTKDPSEEPDGSEDEWGSDADSEEGTDGTDPGGAPEPDEPPPPPF